MCVLPSPRDPAVFGMEIEEAPDVRFSQIGGLDIQISEIREIVELPLKRPDLFMAVASSRLKEFCCTGRRAQVRPYSPKP